MVQIGKKKDVPLYTTVLLQTPSQSANPSIHLEFAFYRCLNVGLKSWNEIGLYCGFNALFNGNYKVFFSPSWLPQLEFSLPFHIHSKLNLAKIKVNSGKVWTYDPPLIMPKHNHYVNSCLVITIIILWL